MNSDKRDMIRRLNFENLIWIGFIVISILDIYGDELIKKELMYDDKLSGNKAKKLFLNITLFSLLIYIYFLFRNYNDYKKYKNKDYKIRTIGSILVLAGTLCFLYFQVKNNDTSDSLSEL